MWVGVCVCPCFYHFFPCNISFTLKACCLNSLLFKLETLNKTFFSKAAHSMLFVWTVAIKYNQWVCWSCNKWLHIVCVCVCLCLCVRDLMDRHRLMLVCGLDLRCVIISDPLLCFRDPRPWDLTYNPRRDSCESSAGPEESEGMGSPVGT